MANEILSDNRTVHLVLQMIDDFCLDLSGLKVYTEAASGAYLATPILAALAGADKVFAQTRDSRYARAESVIENTIKLARTCSVADKIEIVVVRDHEKLKHADIVTNSGFVRPIDHDLITSLKPTAVIPLMWETWELREEDFDLNLCKKLGILSLGTNELIDPCDMSPYNGFLALKMLFELGFEAYGTNVILLGNSPTPAGAIYKLFQSCGINTTWFSAGNASEFTYSDLNKFIVEHGKSYDVIVVAEHAHPNVLIGRGGYVEIQTVLDSNPNISLGVICGNVNVDELQSAGIRYYPSKIQPFGFMSYQPYELGPRPVLQLYAAGLKVGQLMARARITGLSSLDAAREVLKNELVMDFKGSLAWV